MEANAATIITLLEALLRAFEREGVEYALCGGRAVAIWGVPRLAKEHGDSSQLKGIRDAAR